MPEMKYYISHGKWKTEYWEPEAFRLAMEDWTKKVEEVGMKVVFWGSPLGVSENVVCVLKGTPDNFLKIPFGEAPWTDQRTNVVITF